MRARELHPDKSPDPQATQLFQALVEAYETLKDPELRYMYDATLEEKHLACSRCLTLKN
jgi:DnaJ-class molecular chaperone